MKQCKCPVVRGANLAIALAAVITTLSQGAFAAGMALGEPLSWKVRSVNEAAWSLKGWQREAYSLGNGYFGASVFGGVATEHIQLTEPTFCTRQTDRHGKLRGNLTDALDVAIAFGHGTVRDYLRELDLDDAIATLSYESDGVRYTRECFVSYPARALAMRLTASKPGALSFVVRAEIPFPDEPPPFDRTGKVEVCGGEIAVSEVSGAYGTRLAARLKVVTDGTMETEGEALRVNGAREATLYISLGTDYELKPEMFAKIGRKRPLKRPFGKDPSAAVAKRVADAAALGWDTLKAQHVADFRSVAGKSSIELDFDPEDAKLTTAELRKKGVASAYLAILYWKFGKYLLASSSRPGTLPASLQGVWSGPVAKTSWGAGYWHNINEQMNYWPAFTCNMAECFEAYAVFNRAFRPATRTAAEDYVRRVNPAAAEEPFSPDVWTVGTAVYPYEIQAEPSGHSGPGTGGLTAALYIDWYDFTQDRRILEDECWPVVHGMADLLTRCVIESNGLWLAAVSASPEQVVKGRGYYTTVGCAFDQQMIELNNSALLKYAKELGREDDPVVRRAAAQAGKYEGVIVGASGQIKEFREENEYGEIGEKDHRHISHLVGLYPGSLITRATPEGLEAAKRTLDLRGDETTGWARAHRACCRARTGEGDKALEIVGGLIRDKSRDNLWNLCGGVNQVDGNLGATAAIAELLVQSHERDENGDFRIDFLPALPKAWAKRGAFKGLCARGGKVVDCEWRDGKVVSSSVRGISKENGQ